MVQPYTVQSRENDPHLFCTMFCAMLKKTQPLGNNLTRLENLQPLPFQTLQVFSPPRQSCLTQILAQRQAGSNHLMVNCVAHLLVMCTDLRHAFHVQFANALLNSRLCIPVVAVALKAAQMLCSVNHRKMANIDTFTANK